MIETLGAVEASATAPSSPLVTVSMPYHGCPDVVRRAVESILGQSFTDFVLIVVNDADTDTPPWSQLDDIDDPRLIRFELDENRGRYYADAVTLAACNTEWWAPHDADDWSEPNRLQRLLDMSTSMDVVLGAQIVHGITARRQELEQVQRWDGSRRLRHHAHMAGLWRTEWLRSVGGPHPGYRVGYDTVMTGLPWLAGRVAILKEPLYHRCRRNGSLTTAAATTFGSTTRIQAIASLTTLWSAAIDGRNNDGLAGVANAVKATIPDALLTQVKHDADNLARVLCGERPEAPITPCQPQRVPTGIELIDNPKLFTDGWALHPGTAAELGARLAVAQPRMIVETGSGHSTLMLARYAKATGAKVVSLEHAPRYYTETLLLLQRYGLANVVDLRQANLRQTPVGPWYDTILPDGIDFALIDGPPGYTGGRAAVLPALLPYLAHRWEAWVDDANRPNERGAVTSWRDEYGLSVMPIGCGRGVYVIAPSELDRATVDASDVAVTVLTGRRPELLQTTLDSLFRTAPGLMESAHVAMFHNGTVDDQATATVIDGYRHVVDVLATHNGPPLPIGDAVNQCAAFAVDSGRTYWLHLEDDWEAVTAHDGWLDDARVALDDHDICQVRLRHRGDKILGYHMFSNRPIRWIPAGAWLVADSAHITFNPSLMRVGDVAQVWPVTGEQGAQQKAWAAGWRGVVQLHPGVFRHIGDGSSLRLDLDGTRWRPKPRHPVTPKVTVEAIVK